jgi:hypothetical protein
MDETKSPEGRQPEDHDQTTADQRPPDDDEVEEASEDSFPASDPPSFTGTTTD